MAGPNSTKKALTTSSGILMADDIENPWARIQARRFRLPSAKHNSQEPGARHRDRRRRQADRSNAGGSLPRVSSRKPANTTGRKPTASTRPLSKTAANRVLKSRFVVSVLTRCVRAISATLTPAPPMSLQPSELLLQPTVPTLRCDCLSVGVHHRSKGTPAVVSSSRA
jgi:hypothetical protein